MMTFIDSFTQGQYAVRSASGKQMLHFEDSDQFGPSKLDPRKDELSLIPDKHWFWRFYQPWREAGRPTDGERTYRYGVIKNAIWALAPDTPQKLTPQTRTHAEQTAQTPAANP